MPTILSYGMGVESSAILVRWIVSPEARPCPLDELIVITAQVGDEYRDTGRDVENHVLPLMRANRIRYVQVARHGHLEADGITVLDVKGRVRSSLVLLDLTKSHVLSRCSST